ncbi:MAG: ATP-binding protein [Rhodobacteraceae bacterium]|nr:ATP-binding protein [Paracoccaceae bacterium]
MTAMARNLGLLDGPVEPEYDRLVALLANKLRAPVGLLSIVDKPGRRQHFKSLVGLSEPWASRRETPISHSFCLHVHDTGRPMVVPDARVHPQLCDNPAIQDLGVIAYMGAPIRDTAQQVVAVLCVLDHRPRNWASAELDDLQTVGQAIANEIGLRQALHLTQQSRADAESAAAALEETDQRFRDLALNVPGAIFRYVMRPDGSDWIEYMSPGCHDVWEVSEVSLKGNPKALWDTIVPEDLESMVTSVRQSAENLTQWIHRWRIRTASGALKWLRGSGMPRRLDDGSVLWNTLILDVTAEAAAQERLTAYKKLLFQAQKQDSIGRMASSIAHDFNNLMSVVMGNAQLLQSGAVDDDAPHLLREIDDAAKRGGALAHRLLSFGAGARFVRTDVDVNATVRSIEPLMRRALPPKITLETDLCADLGRVGADLSFLESALLNLVLNARDAMPEGGRLCIRTTRHRVDEGADPATSDLQPGCYAMISVKDTGVGIAPDKIADVFEPFVSTKRGDGGFGLGLPMVQTFAIQSGGSADLISEPGKGTTVRLFIRAEPARGGPPCLPDPAA